MRAPLSCLTLALALSLSQYPLATFAQNAQAQKSIDAASEAAVDAAQEGPAQITLGSQAVLKLPADMLFVPKQQAQRLMEAYGNGMDPKLMGVVLPKSNDSDWLATIDFEDEGYIKEDDAKDWDTKALLQDLKDGTEEANKERRKLGVDEMTVDGWTEEPKYDLATHRLVWAAQASNKTDPENDTDPTVNYNTYALGRDGYISLDMITSRSQVATDKGAALTLLNNISYVEGKRYADFDASSDHVAEYGIAALVAGAAAKKLGLLAVIGAFLAKFGKIALLGGAAGGAAFVRRLFGKKKPPSTDA